MNILVFGADNQLGESYTQLLEQNTLGFVALKDDAREISELSSLKALVADKHITQIVNVSLNPGLFQSEQAIEKDRKQHLTLACNNLLSVAKASRIPLLHHSSAAVFDGSNPKPYLENEACKANNPLGKLAYSLERKIAKYEKKIILRTEGIFGPAKPGFFRDCIDLCKQQSGRLELLDQRCSPTPVSDVARVLVAINQQLDCDAQAWGIFHYCALQATHRHTFVEKFLNMAATYDEALSACLENLEITTRQSNKTQLDNSVLDCHKIMSAFGIKQRSRVAALKELIASIYQT